MPWCKLVLEDEMVETCALGFLFAVCVLSFHDARPRGVSGHWYEDDDELTIEERFTEPSLGWIGKG